MTLLLLKYFISSFETFLRKDSTLSTVSVLANWHFPVGGKTGCDEALLVSIPQDHSQVHISRIVKCPSIF